MLGSIYILIILVSYWEKKKIVGQPALNRLHILWWGKNTGEEPINGEIWLDELRLSGIKKEKGCNAGSI